MKVEIETEEDNSSKILNIYEERKKEILYAMGNELYKSIYDFMTQDKVVDTGRLRGSISYSTPSGDYNQPTPANTEDDFIKNVREKDTIVYGSNVPYATYVEAGTSKQRARGFIKNGTYRAVPQLKSTFMNILKGG